MDNTQKDDLDTSASQPVTTRPRPVTRRVVSKAKFRENNGRTKKAYTKAGDAPAKLKWRCSRCQASFAARAQLVMHSTEHEPAVAPTEPVPPGHYRRHPGCAYLALHVCDKCGWVDPENP